MRFSGHSGDAGRNGSENQGDSHLHPQDRGSVRLAPRPLHPALIEHEAGNFEPADHHGLLIKENYWRWPDHDMSGNTIDFFTQVLRMSFHATMVAITESNPPSNPS